MRVNRPPNCPLETALGLIAGKWKGVILFHLMDDKKRFGELRQFMPSVTQRMMTKQLRELESDGLIHREVYNVVPPKVEYSLTEKAQALKPIMVALEQWGKTFNGQAVD